MLGNIYRKIGKKITRRHLMNDLIDLSFVTGLHQLSDHRICLYASILRIHIENYLKKSDTEILRLRRLSLILNYVNVCHDPGTKKIKNNVITYYFLFDVRPVLYVALQSRRMQFK